MGRGRDEAAFPMEADMFATKILSAEHDVILQVLKSLDLLQCSMQQGRHPAPDLLEKSIVFFQNYADRFHHFKEEYLMFPRDSGLRDGGGPTPLSRRRPAPFDENALRSGNSRSA